MHRLIRSLKRFIASASFRLASTYLMLIMLLSIGFSVVFYNASSTQLGRQIPPNSLFTTKHSAAAKQSPKPPGIDQFFHERIREGRTELLDRLIIVNCIALVVGSGLSYVLARRTLRPIEQAVDAQVQFVSDASHELRTPLTVIQTSNDVALRSNTLTLKQAKAVIRSNTEQAIMLKELSDGLLQLARQEDSHSITLTETNLQDAASAAINQVIPLAQAKEVTIDDASPSLSVLAQTQVLTQILVILLDNAIKYSPKHGTIYIEGSRRGHYGYLSVRDNGDGIRASDVPHIFRRFYRADSARTGSSTQSGYGLGLSIAQSLVTQQRGSISVHSEPGNGATFTIKLIIR